MNDLKKSILDCKKCELWKTRNNPVIGDGSTDASIMFIGEAPGHNEDLQGKPFVGRAGKFLDDLLNSINLNRNEIYIANILKCRPPNNRNPYESEIKECSSFLDKQMGIIKPKIIATLGNFSTEYILNKFGLKTEKISKIHGKKFHIRNLTFDMMIIPLYHPAAAVYNPNMKSILLSDFKKIEETLSKITL